MFVTKRAYEPFEASDGFRVLVDRLWPRGISKARAHVDLWAKDIAPSADLRNWYEHEPAKWPEFRKRYARELRAPAAAEVLDDLVRRAKRGRVTLVYASHAGDISNAAALALLLNARVKRAAARRGGRAPARSTRGRAKAAARTRG